MYADPTALADASDAPLRPAPRAARSAGAAFTASLLLHLGLLAGLWSWQAGHGDEPAPRAVEVSLLPSAPPAPPALSAAPPARPVPVPEPAHPRRVTTTHAAAAPAPAAAIEAQATAAPAPLAAVQAPAAGDAPLPTTVPREVSIEAAVLTWLAAHRSYPRAARRAHLEGVVRVSAVLRPDGQLVERRIVQSSGHALLDRAALDLLERASPLPASVVAGVAGEIELFLPIEYRMSI